MKLGNVSIEKQGFEIEIKPESKIERDLLSFLEYKHAEMIQDGEGNLRITGFTLEV